MRLRSEKKTARSGGSSDATTPELAVAACGSRSTIAITTATPLAI
jgi:hypothetical protein